MKEKQKTIDGEYVDVKPHPEDAVLTCDTDWYRPRSECFFDAEDNPYAYEESRDDANRELLKDYVEKRSESAEEYAQHPDYGSNYHFLIGENPDHAITQIVEWVDSQNYNLPLAVIDKLVDKSIDDCEMTYVSGYGCGPDITLDSFPLDELEEQLEGDEEFDDLLAAIPNADDILSDLGVHTRYGYYLYVYVGGDHWSFHVSDSFLQETLTELIVEYCRDKDRS